MKLRKITRHTDECDEVWIEPAEFHLLFKHCSGGMIRVKKRDYEKTVAPLLMIHGIELLQFIE